MTKCSKFGLSLACTGNALENCCAISMSSCVYLDMAIKPHSLRCSAEGNGMLSVLSVGA